jgi:zinc/manganese transport system permease protein
VPSAVRDLFAYAFMVHAFEAGSVVAVVAGTVGWFVVLRRQTFASHTLAVAGVPGAAGAALVGVSAALGGIVFCVAAALAIALVPARGSGAARDESAAVGTVQAFALACGFLFVSLYHGNVNAITTVLFGTFLGITAAQVGQLAVTAVVVLVVLAAMARPLVFASVDGDVAGARGVPVRMLSVGFLVLLGIAVAQVSQITGALLVFALLVLPAATAQVLTARPGRSVALSVAIALGVVWVALAAAYWSPYPLGFWVTSIAFGAYVVARIGRTLATRAQRSGAAAAPEGALGPRPAIVDGVRT